MRGGRRCRFEPLEQRFLLSVASAIEQPVDASQDAWLACGACGVFSGDGNGQTAIFEFVFDGVPTVEEIDGGAIVSLEGEETWVSTGDPLMPVRESMILLPQGMAVTSIDAQYLDAGVVIAEGVQLLATPVAVPLSSTSDLAVESVAFVSSSFGQQEAVEYSNHTLCGYDLATLTVFPVEYDAAADVLIYHSEVSVVVTAAVEADEAVSPRDSEPDRERVIELVDNPEAISLYTTAASTSEDASTMLPAAGQYEYVIVTSSALEDSFQPLASQKISRGISATIVTTEYIYANYSGTETGDGADRIRNFIADAYANWGTQWVLLGGDSEVIPYRGVYASVGSTVEYSLPTDMYYACLEGTWNGDGDGLWGESNDGTGGGDVDLTAEVYVGRAPTSNVTEAANFVSKTIQYETTGHANATTAVWLGEQLDDSTWGSYSGIPIADQCIPEDWTVIERYDSDGGWSGSQFAGDLQDSPHLVNHLGHANETYNARLVNSTVASLTNTDPYFMYSQGCMSGSFDTHDRSIAEQHVVAEYGAFGVVMNSRYGWYVPGDTPGASHHYALEFWDAAFNEGLTHLGEANQDSKDDSLFRVGSTGVYRWIHFETNLFGDPETPLQIGEDAVTNGEIEGVLVEDVNGDGQQQPGEAVLVGETVFLDLNDNGVLDVGTITVASNDVPVDVVDNTTVTSSLLIASGARVADVNVTLDITHTYDGDLKVYLVSPSGTKVELFTNVGSWGDNFTDTTLDDEAGTSIADAAAPFSGTFRPEGRLSRFDGELATGTWTLEITDTMTADTGTLNAWSLEITFDEPYTQTGADGTFVFTDLPEGTYRVRHALSSGWEHTNPVDGVQVVSVQQGETVQGVDFLASEATPATELGEVDFLQIADLNLAGAEHWYSCQTARQGYLTIEALFQEAASLEVRLYDADRNELAASTASDGGERIDWDVDAGQTFYLSVTGDAADVDLRLANLVHYDGAGVSVYGTDGDDRLEFAAGEWHQVTINGVHYEFQVSAVSSFEFDGGAGDDAAVLLGSAGADTAVLHPSRATLSGPGYEVAVANTADVTVMGQGGDDVGCFYDSAGDDTFVATTTHARLYGDGFDNQLYAFGQVHAFSREGGTDVAELYDSAGNDSFMAAPEYAKLYGDGFFNRVVSFAQVHAYATAGGNDVVALYDSAGDDDFVATPDEAKLYGDGFFNRAVGFRWVHAYATAGGSDVATLSDSTGNDQFRAWPDEAKLYGYAFFNRAVSFDQVHAYATGDGSDLARLYDSAGDDLFTGTPDDAALSGDGFYNRAVAFRYVLAYATAGGNDEARLYDSPGDDRFVATPDYAKIYGSEFYHLAVAFRYVHAYATAGGTDLAKLYDSSGDDVFVGTPDDGKLYGTGFSNRAVGFRYVEAYATAGGNDTVNLYDSAGDDRFVATPDYAKIWGYGFYHRAVSFESVEAYAGAGGYDRAYLYDSAGDDHLEASGSTAALFNADLSVWAYDFARVSATSSQGGTDTKHVASIDFVLQTQGPWTEL